MATINSFPIPTRAATKADVGLGSVDNTADSAKPVSTAQAAAIAAKADAAATTSALAGKQDKLVSGSNIKTVNGQSILGSGDLVVTGGGGATLQSGPLVSDPAKAPNAEAVANAIAAVTAGSVAPIDTAFATAIPLDKVQGREMGMYAMSGNLTLTVAGGAVTNGSCNLTLVGDGTSTLDISAFTNGNGFVFDKSANKVNELAFVKRPTGAYVFGTVGGTYSVPDTTAPTLTSPTGTATGATTANGSVTTNEANGTLYAIVSLNSTPPTAMQIQAGQDNTGATAKYATSKAVTTTGAQSFSATGLTASTGYYWHYQHKDAAGNNSTVVTSPTFTTSAVVAGVLSQTAYTPAGSRNLTVDGVTDWGWRVTNLKVRRKASGQTPTCPSFGAGSEGTAAGVTYTISDGAGAGVDAADTSDSWTYKNMDASEGGWTWTAKVGNVTQTVDIEFGIGAGTVTVTPTLSDGSATLAPFTVSGGGNKGLRFTARTGDANGTLSVKLSGSTGSGVDFIKTGAVVVYPA